MNKLHLNQEFTIVKEWTADSKSIKTWGIPTIHIIFKGVLDGEEYKTYIVEGFKNNKLWEEILSQPYKQLLVRFPKGKLRKNVIDADSTPVIVATRDQLQKQLNDLFD
jgi:hypothetical protein